MCALLIDINLKLFSSEVAILTKIYLLNKVSIFFCKHLTSETSYIIFFHSTISTTTKVKLTQLYVISCLEILIFLNLYPINLIEVIKIVKKFPYSTVYR